MGEQRANAWLFSLASTRDTRAFGLAPDRAAGPPYGTVVPPTGEPLSLDFGNVALGSTV